MKRILMHTLLTAGLFLLASNSAFAQRHRGWPEGTLNPGGGEPAPAIRSEIPGNAPAIRNEIPGNRPAIANEGGAHPFYNNERGGENEWRYRYNDNRWWYWTALGGWAYWNDGRWVDYNQPYTTYYRGATAPAGWYWSNDQHRWYWFDGATLSAAPQ